MATYKILIVEDEPGIRENVAEQLRSWDMDVRIVTDFRKVTADFAEYQPHLVLLDISLPFMNGYHWCKEIRSTSKVPIIFVSSAADNMNIVMAMTMGADDFIAKPFDGNVLVAKVQALLRRTYDFAESVSVLEHRGALLNTEDGTLSYQGEKITLSKNEFRILMVLMKNKGKIVSREKLMEALWQTDAFVDENALTVNVGRLRKKLEGAGLENFIETKFGQGYLISQES
ncbi:MAG: response regulator transcription factor [Lachnospiraceae bacterium]|jgi:DNA-binding response OmpR family regulator|nr:response regulator transcription factor [Lachnospiraceae bacterium]MBP5264591.1 response regulator transcription factor [Lachnospiraceae bacterium]MBP5669744.1 response regulator transcription factor [Lachnospiraceae bacterium]MBR3468736.1 response regulator transcription factor [Lachnospiraceae bacterium]MCR5501252.1 response regulator transcription factor [Acetatifactor sp.]